MASVANGMFGGKLPWTMIAIGVAIGAAIIALDEWLKARKSNFRVPVLAAAIGIYLPLELMVPIFLGGLLAYFVESRKKLKRSEEHTSELQSLIRSSYAVFCYKKKYHKHPDQ